MGNGFNPLPIFCYVGIKIQLFDLQRQNFKVSNRQSNSPAVKRQSLLLVFKQVAKVDLLRVKAKGESYVVTSVLEFIQTENNTVAVLSLLYRLTNNVVGVQSDRREGGGNRVDAADSGKNTERIT